MISAETMFSISAIIGDLNLITAGTELDTVGTKLGAGSDTRGLLQATAHPRSAAEVGELIRLAHAKGFAIVTVDGALGAGRDSVFLDLRHLNRIDPINRTNLTVDVQAGAAVGVVEERLQRDRLTLGMLPKNTREMSVSEWLGRRAGFFPTSHRGSWTDLVLALSGVLANGETFASRRTPRSAVGPDLDHLVIGGRGTVAVITAATLSIRPAPAWSVARAFIAHDFPAGMEAVRRVCLSGEPPALARLLDTDLTAMVASRALIGRTGAMLEMVYEGEDCALSRARAKHGFRLAAADCLELTAADGDRCLALTCDIPPPALETTATWSKADALYQALTTTGATGIRLVFASPQGVVLGCSGAGDAVIKAAASVGATQLSPAANWPLAAAGDHRRLLRDWKLRIDPGFTLNPALIPEEP